MYKVNQNVTIKELMNTKRKNECKINLIINSIETILIKNKKHILIKTNSDFNFYYNEEMKLHREDGYALIRNVLNNKKIFY